MSQNETNDEFIYRIMTTSKYGGLVQAFVIEAISRYVEEVASSPVSEHGFINMETWRNIALDLQDELAKKYGIRAKAPKVVQGGPG